MSTFDIVKLVSYAADTLRVRKEEVNRLNVFPVPDGDTGTNMSLTMDSVVKELKSLGSDADYHAMRKAVAHGALMGARGNSGVILSQILRGLTDGLSGSDMPPTSAQIATAAAKAVEVAFQAVRKPVEGTILTVLRDSSDAAQKAAQDDCDFATALKNIALAASYSVRRTPDLLPVLKENNVVDAGGFGLAILLEAVAGYLSGDSSASHMADLDSLAANQPKVEIEQINDWEGSAYRYCNEFLFHAEEFDSKAGLEFLTTMGDCELLVGEVPNFKVHVHSNTPDKVLAYFLQYGQIFEVHIHNMQLQSAERNEKIAAENVASAPIAPATPVSQNMHVVPAGTPLFTKKEKEQSPRKELGIVAVSSGSGTSAILESLGVDTIVSGGQTMNPSTADLLSAMESINAKKVIVLPNNKNIIMAAQSAVEVFDGEAAVIPTKSVLHAFSALFALDPSASFESNIEAMEEAAGNVRVGEVTTAIKDATAANGEKICNGDIIGIADGSINSVGKSVIEVTLSLLAKYAEEEEFDILTVLAGEDMSDESLDELVSKIEETYPDAEVDSQRGEQPLYPVIFSVE